VINTAVSEIAPTISADGLELYFCDFTAPRAGGLGKSDIWVSKRASKDAEWGPPVNLGPVVNGPDEEITPEISPDGLELYFESSRAGGFGADDLWVSRRASRYDSWGRPVNLGPTINTAGNDHCPNITSDGLTLFYDSGRAADTFNGYLMMARRSGLGTDWGTPVNLGHAASDHYGSSISSNGIELYFASTGPGGSGGNDIWMMPISIK
jgi:hypothetical protein